MKLNGHQSFIPILQKMFHFYLNGEPGCPSSTSVLQKFIISITVWVLESPKYNTFTPQMLYFHGVIESMMLNIDRDTT